MADKFTPGPWVATGYKDIIVNDSRGTTLAIHPGDSREYGIEEVQANARLIAAAPELLEALRGVLEYLDNGTPVYVGCELEADIRAAVAKALGE